MTRFPVRKSSPQCTHSTTAEGTVARHEGQTFSSADADGRGTMTVAEQPGHLTFRPASSGLILNRPPHRQVTKIGSAAALVARFGAAPGVPAEAIAATTSTTSRTARTDGVPRGSLDLSELGIPCPRVDRYRRSASAPGGRLNNPGPRETG